MLRGRGARRLSDLSQTSSGRGIESTFRADSVRDLEAALARAGRAREYNVEEFIEAEEYTYDTICVDGRVLYENFSWYRPRPLVGRSVEWISPQTITLRDVGAPELEAGRALGRDVLKALGHDTGFAHMEWYRKSDGEAVFGEIAARPPGAHTVDTMNFACDLDLFTGWAGLPRPSRSSRRRERGHVRVGSGRGRPHRRVS